MTRRPRPRRVPATRRKLRSTMTANPPSALPAPDPVARGASPAILLVALVVGLFPLASSAAVEIRRGGAAWCVVADDGTVRIDGRAVGRIEPNGTVRVGGAAVGRVEDDGTIRDGGRNVGRIETDGTLRMGGRSVGRIESGGTLRREGRAWGSASDCCGDFGSRRTVAAVLVFFGGWKN